MNSDVSSNENNQVNTVSTDNTNLNNEVNQFSGVLSNSVSGNENNQVDEYNSILDSIGIDSNLEKNNINATTNVVPEIDVSNLSNEVKNVSPSADVSPLGSSYIDQVKNRIQNSSVPVSGNINNVNQMKYGNELGSVNVFEPNANVNLNKEVISDKNELPELESLSNEEVSASSNKKGKSGAVIVLIIIVLLLGFVSYYLYNYVF